MTDTTEMETIKIFDDTTWPDPSGLDYQTLTWKLMNAPEHISESEARAAAEVMQAYSDLILHPAFTLKVVQVKISGIRQRIKGRRNADAA